jgi:hypothetical protein
MAPIVIVQAPASAWSIVSYEITMRENLHVMSPRTIANALTESRILHARQQCDVFLSKGSDKDDIQLEHLVPGWRSAANCARLRLLIDDLTAKYGTRHIIDSPCWEFNKKMAHPTLGRGYDYNYARALNTVEPVLTEVVKEIESITGRNFERNF